MARLTMPQEYAATPLSEITIQLKSEWLAVANEYLNINGNALGAYRAAYEEHEGIKRLPKGTDSEIQNTMASRANYILKKPIVAAYVLKAREKRNLKAIESNDRSYDAWHTQMGELRDSAKEAGQYSPSIRAHELIGKADGHIDANRLDAVSRVSDDALIEQLVNVLGVQASTLHAALNNDVPEAEVIETD